MDAQVYGNKIASNNRPTGWVPISGGTFLGRPSATSDMTVPSQGNPQPTARTVWVAAIGQDLRIYVNPGSGAAVFPGWTAISDDQVTSAPAIAFGGHSLLVCAQKSDQMVYCASNDVTFGYSVTNWTGFAPIPGGTVLNEPSVAYDGASFRVVAEGRDQAGWTTKLSGGSWLPWTQIPGGTFQGPPAISSTRGGHVDVFGVGFDNQMYFTSADSGGTAWNGFQVIPNATFMSEPAAYSRPSAAPTLISVMAMGDDERIWQSTYTP
jgi:hypothetical protein